MIVICDRNGVCTHMVLKNLDSVCRYNQLSKPYFSMEYTPEDYTKNYDGPGLGFNSKKLKKYETKLRDYLNSEEYRKVMLKKYPFMRSVFFSEINNSPSYIVRGLCMLSMQVFLNQYLRINSPGLGMFWSRKIEKQGTLSAVFSKRENSPNVIHFLDYLGFDLVFSSKTPYYNSSIHHFMMTCDKFYHKAKEFLIENHDNSKEIIAYRTNGFFISTTQSNKYREKHDLKVALSVDELILTSLRRNLV